MRNLARTTAFMSTLAVLVGCGDRTVADDDGLPPKPPDMGAMPESEGESEGGVVCRDGLTACEGECVDLTANDEHCGACHHVCREPYWAGHCVEGACPSAYWCGSVGQGLETCEDVCALHGQVCDEGPRTLSRGCGGSYHLYFDREGLEKCELGFGGQNALQASCTTPIDWSIEGGWDDEPAVAVACCCSQDLPP
jgi:hypothetical protein